MAQALFANQRETNLASTLALVEQVLGELGVGSKIADAGALHAWEIRKGSAVIHVQLLSRPEFTHIRVTAVVMTLDAKVDRAAMFAHLLAQNAGLCGGAFALDGDRVLLVNERSTLDLDKSEILDLINRVTAYADDYDDQLVAKFGGTLGAT
jgi:T3SS (YopN, CesT) and YbjN peptide-binding chaperone 1